MYFGIPLDELPTPLLPPVSCCISFMWLGMNDSASADSDVACVNKICLHYSSEIQLTSNKKLFGAIIQHAYIMWAVHFGWDTCRSVVSARVQYSTIRHSICTQLIQSLILRAVANFYQINRFNRNYWKKNWFSCPYYQDWRNLLKLMWRRRLDQTAFLVPIVRTIVCRTLQT